MKVCLVILSCLVGLGSMTSSLTFSVDQENGKNNCYYIQKVPRDKITASFQIMHGDLVDFTLLDPKNNVIYTQKNTDGYELEQTVHIGGDYGFCFSKSGSNVPTSVHFEWDFHLGSPEEGAFKKKLEDEKRRFLMNKIKENKPKVVSGSGVKGIKPVEMHGQIKYDDYEAFEMDSLAHALLLISFNADRMEHYINLHKSKQALSHNIQIQNAAYINYHSLIVISLVILLSSVQVVMVKSFFSGKINLRIWEF